MKLFISFVLFCLSFIYTSSCKSIGSDPFVGNGIPTDDYPAVLQITHVTEKGASDCTAFVVSSNTLLTAAHCLVNTNAVYVTGNIQSFKAVSFIPHKDFKLDDYSTYNRDIGIVVFNEDIFSRIKPLEIYTKDIEYDREVRLVGYGCMSRQIKSESKSQSQIKSEYRPIEFDCDEDKLLQKRTGTNKARKNLEGCSAGMYSVVSLGPKFDDKTKNPDGKNVYMTRGDSGSPLLLENDQTKVVGIASSMTTTSSAIISCYTATVNQENLDFLKESAEKLNVKIKGIN